MSPLSGSEHSLTDENRSKLLFLYLEIETGMSRVARSHLRYEMQDQCFDVVDDVFAKFAELAVKGELPCLDQRRLSDISLRELKSEFAGRCYGYLRTMVRNRCLALLRRHATLLRRLKQLGRDAELQMTSCEDILELAEKTETIRDAINALSDQKKIVVIMFAYEGYSHKDISEELDIPVGTVKSRLSTAYKQMKQHLISAGVDSA